MTDPETAQKINEMVETLMKSGLATNRSDAYDRAKEIILGPDPGKELNDAEETEEEMDHIKEDIKDSNEGVDENVNKLVKDVKRHQEGKDTAQYFIDLINQEEEE